MQRTSFTLILIISFLFSFSQKTWVGFTADSPQQPGISIVEQNAEKVIVDISVPGMYVSDVENQGTVYKRLELTEFQTTSVVGYPELPTINQIIGIPGDKLARFRIIEMNKIILSDYNIYPFQVPEKDIKGGKSDEFIINKDFYSQNKPFPSGNIILDAPGIWRDVKITGLHIVPFTYYPQKKEIEVITHLKIEVEFYGHDSEHYLARDKSITPEYYRMYNAAISNFASLGYTMTYRDNPGIKYLIITNEGALQTIQPLIDFKNQQGFRVEVKTLGPGFEAPQDFKTYIQQIYQSDGLEYVLIVGDAYPNGGQGGGPNIVPMFWWAPSGEDASFSDTWYVCLDGPDDHFADLAIGRFVYDELDELDIQIQKTMSHYTNPDASTNWAENTILVAHQEDYPEKYTRCKEEIRTYNYALQTPIFTPCYGGAGATNNDIVNYVNNTSCGIFNYRGHGSATEFGEWCGQGSFTNTHVQQLTNTRRLFVLFDVCCDNMDIVAFGGDCLCESFMKSPVASVAINGAIIPSYTIPNHDYDKEMYKAVFQEGIYNIGYVTNFANITVLNIHDSLGRANVRTYLWLGDASLEPWTLQPAELTVTHDSQLFLGLTEFSVSVNGNMGPVENAMVCISNEDGSIYGVAYTDAAGLATVAFSEPAHVPGFAKVTVTSHNYLPYQAEIPVIPLEGAYVVKDSFTINDEAGNANGLMDYGETIALTMTVKNVGLESATGVTVELGTSDEYISLTTNSAYFGDIPAEGTVTVANAFAFNVASTIPDNHNVLFEVSATDGTNIWVSNFSIQGYAPVFEFGSMTISDPTGNGNNRLDPGEIADITINIINNGHSDAAEVLASLSTTSAFLTLNTTSSNLGVLAAGLSGNAVFNISVDPGTPIGSSVDLICNIESGMYSVNKTFYSKVGLMLEDWESGTFNDFDWSFSGNSQWTVTDQNPYEGLYCAQSGDISDLQNSQLSLDYNVMYDDTISFYRKVSSEASYDYLEFYIDNTKIDQWSGEQAWEKVSYPVTAGPHTFTWNYMKDYSESNGQDAAWIDFISLPPELVTTAYAGPDMTICQSNTCALTGTATLYNTLEWTTSGTGTFDDNTLLNAVYTLGEEDINTGEVILTLTAYGPSDEVVSDQMVLTIYKLPVVFAGEDTGICAGESVPITQATAENYFGLLWTTAGDGTFDNATILTPVYTPGIQDLLAGTFTLTLSAVNEPCENITDDVVFTINPLPTPSISGLQETCLGTSGVLYSTQSYEGNAYNWMIAGGTITDGQGTAEVTVTWEQTGDGSISVQETNNFTGCQASSSTDVKVHALPLVMLGADTSICHNHHLTLDAGNPDAQSWVWSTGQNTQSIVIDSTGAGIGGTKIILVTITDTKGCTASDEISVYFEDCSGIADNAYDLAINIFPNPNKGTFILELLPQEQDVISIRIVNASGATVSEENNIKLTGKMRKEFKLDNGDGIYYLYIESKKVHSIKKVVVQR